MKKNVFTPLVGQGQTERSICSKNGDKKRKYYSQFSQDQLTRDVGSHTNNPRLENCIFFFLLSLTNTFYNAEYRFLTRLEEKGSTVIVSFGFENLYWNHLCSVSVNDI